LGKIPLYSPIAPNQKPGLRLHVRRILMTTPFSKPSSPGVVCSSQGVANALLFAPTHEPRSNHTEIVISGLQKTEITKRWCLFGLSRSEFLHFASFLEPPSVTLMLSWTVFFYTETETLVNNRCRKQQLLLLFCSMVHCTIRQRPCLLCAGTSLSGVGC